MITRSAYKGLTTLLGGLLSLTACAPQGVDVPDPRLVLLYATCTLNRDYLYPYNKEIPFTPNLQKFAEKSVVFTKHHTESGQSGIAFASIFTGSHADRHGVYRHPTKLSESALVITEAYAEQGYDTFHWSGHAMASNRLGYGRGVDRENVFGYYLTGDDPVFRDVLRRLKADPEYKAFILTNFSVTHGPYSKAQLDRFRKLYPSETGGLTPDEVTKWGAVYRKNYLPLQWNHDETVERLGFQAEELEKIVGSVELLYKSKVAFLDSLFGAVVGKIAWSGLLDDSLIVFTSDHGEILYRENAVHKWTHGMQLAPEVIQVPLIIRFPSSESQGSRYDEVTRSIDVFPTMLALSGISTPKREKIDGVDLALQSANRRPGALRAFFHTSIMPGKVLERMRQKSGPEKYGDLAKNFPSDDVRLTWVGMREGAFAYKLLRTADGEWSMDVFDWTRDPGETKNLFRSDDRQQKKNLTALEDYKSLLVAKHGDLSTGKGADRQLPEEEEVKLLKALGYID